MMNAKEMFEKLGYKVSVDYNDIVIYKYEYPLGGSKELIFHKKDDGMFIDYSFKGNATTFLKYKELQAINKQLEELGWNSE